MRTAIQLVSVVALCAMACQLPPSAPSSQPAVSPPTKSGAVGISDPGPGDDPPPGDAAPEPGHDEVSIPSAKALDCASLKPCTSDNDCDEGACFDTACPGTQCIVGEPCQALCDADECEVTASNEICRPDKPAPGCYGNGEPYWEVTCG